MASAGLYLLGEPSIIPPKWRWDKIAPLAGDELELQYRHTLENLGKEKGLIGTIFRKAQNKLTDPAKLKRVVSLIDVETWSGIGVDVKGEIYEGLLEKNVHRNRYARKRIDAEGSDKLLRLLCRLVSNLLREVVALPKDLPHGMDDLFGLGIARMRASAQRMVS